LLGNVQRLVPADGAFVAADVALANAGIEALRTGEFDNDEDATILLRVFDDDDVEDAYVDGCDDDRCLRRSLLLKNFLETAMRMMEEVKLSTIMLYLDHSLRLWLWLLYALYSFGRTLHCHWIERFRMMRMIVIMLTMMLKRRMMNCCWLMTFMMAYLLLQQASIAAPSGSLFVRYQ
jgi:hypothetical protein